jgi:two-component system response regulator HydG
MHVLIVDDDVVAARSLVELLELVGFEATAARSGREALDCMADQPFDAVVTDLNMPDIGGIELCERLLEQKPGIAVIVVTAFSSLESAIAAIRVGAYDFIPKPVDVETLTHALQRAAKRNALREEVTRLSEAGSAMVDFEGMVGASPPMQALFRLIDRVAASNATVLVTGETGTGKEHVARALHARSRRRDAPLVAINCAAVPEPLLESEMFGHARGAFTDARADRAGLLLRASGGTLFFDEIGDMPLGLQAKLLRALQERSIRPVGADRETPIDVRIIAATNNDLEIAVERHRFREDLFYRINVIQIPVPPLRERGNDILLLAQHFVDVYARSSLKPVTALTSRTAERLMSYPWPGNVRELQNCIEHAVALAAHDRITLDDLPDRIRIHHGSTPPAVGSDPSALAPLEEIERRYVEQVLAAVGGRKAAAARVLGLDRKTLYRKLEAYHQRDAAKFEQ